MGHERLEAGVEQHRRVQVDVGGQVAAGQHAGGGLLASDSTTLARQAWVPFN